jgi:spore maturation protein CgeB
LVFNNSIAGDVTMRIFEGTACGALVLTDAVKNGLDKLFEPGREIVVFQDDDDLLAKINYYLTHEAERRQIAAAGKYRTQTEHTYGHRVEFIMQVIRAAGLARCA